MAWRALAAAILLAACALVPGAELAGAGVATAQGSIVPLQSGPADSALEAITSQLAAELRCPVCQGNSIQDSPSELAQEMRNVIRDQLRAGKTPDEVRTYFEDKYGEWILLEPHAKGFNLLVYVAPVIFLLIGGAVIWRSIRRWTSEAPGPT